MALASVDAMPAFLKPEDGVLLTSHEAEYMVETLRAFDIEEVGKAQWMMQHEVIEKLNLQAHYNTMTNSDDFVMGALISHDKLGILIHELLVIEIWLEKICPKIIRNLKEEFSTVQLALSIYHEGSIINLLEVLLYHQEVCEAMDSDSLLELADFCHRKLLYLNTNARTDIAYKEKSAKEYMNMTIQQEFEEKVSCVQFQTSMCALTILRYLTDHINVLPLCIMARLIDKHDIIMSLVPLIENVPWKREHKKSGTLVIEKYDEGKWLQIPKEDYFKITKSDAQVWLALYNLIMEPNCRSRFRYTNFHREQILKLQKHLNEVVLDQIPILKDLQWVLEEISLNVKPKFEEKNTGNLILEQVPILREKLLSSKNWDRIAEMQFLLTFSKAEASTCHIREMLRMFQFGESMEAPKCASCGSPAAQRCSRCKYEWYCGKPCQKKMWTTHKRICDIMSLDT